MFQDGGGAGTITGFQQDGCAWVKWDAGGECHHRIGYNGYFDIELI